MEIADFKKKFERYNPGIMNAKGSFAVLVPLVEVGGETHILYEVRSRNIDVQPNEVCFPGGRMENGETAIECALRETFEEIGVGEKDVEIISPIDVLHPNSGLLIFPILGVIKNYCPEKLGLNPDEVGEVFSVPVEFLKEEPYIYREMTATPGADFPYERMGIPRDYKFRRAQNEIFLYEYEGHPIWGLTAMITRWLMERMKNDENL